jgi:GT2 family glycosyltransferase
MTIAVLLTVHNHVNRTISCLDRLFHSVAGSEDILFDVFITNDGSTDDTEKEINTRFPYDNIIILQGNGNLFWNGGMINSWKAALSKGGYDGYLWLNNDTEVFPNLWDELKGAEQYSQAQFGQGGIYVGSTYNREKSKLTYGGFNFISKWNLKDEFIVPNGTFQNCQCAHGNVTYVSKNVMDKQGLLCEQYMHGGSDHDYTYLAYKSGLPVFVLRDFVAVCENDHRQDGWGEFLEMKFGDRIRFLYSPLGFNLKNTLLFQKRNFPYRYPFIWLTGILKALFPKTYFRLYNYMRR